MLGMQKLPPQQQQQMERQLRDLMQKMSPQQQQMFKVQLLKLSLLPEKCSELPINEPDVKSFLSAVLDKLMGVKIPSGGVKDVKSFLTECGSKQKEFLKVECDKYMATPSFKDGKDKDTFGYIGCCDTLNFCSGPFYTQIWFFAVCGGVALLLIGIIGVVVFLLCCRKKRGGGGSGGGGMKSSKKSTKKSKK
ncbi:hypothetical protein B9Z55_008032 [Caenorhabditis nigoni]|uniref:Uncharacterized protein n=1 Tax=Caenorhabditis nigoni TaxID=1611254 RepID=A0A2G5VCC4_9PELO|nr:hypothetical protein B9Z55_008032 [Caenorhabditis nigoni]